MKTTAYWKQKLQEAGNDLYRKVLDMGEEEYANQRKNTITEEFSVELMKTIIHKPAKPL